MIEWGTVLAIAIAHLGGALTWWWLNRERIVRPVPDDLWAIEVNGVRYVEESAVRERHSYAVPEEVLRDLRG